VRLCCLGLPEAESLEASLGFGLGLGRRRFELWPVLDEVLAWQWHRLLQFVRIDAGGENWKAAHMLCLQPLNTASDLGCFFKSRQDAGSYQESALKQVLLSLRCACADHS